MPSPAPRPPTHRPPSREGVEDGLAYSLWLPHMNDGSSASRPGPSGAGRRVPGMLVLHGAGSRKENHADFARLACANGWAALAFDARGHGASAGEMGPGAVQDVVAMAGMLAAEPGVDPRRVVARGSSMGAFLALHAAADEWVVGQDLDRIGHTRQNGRGRFRGLLQQELGQPLQI